MPTSLAGNWKAIVVGLALSLGFAGAARNAAARNGDTPGGGSGGASASSPAKTDVAKGSTASDPSSPVVLELKELEKAVAEQTKQFDEHSKELDAERAALHDELSRIANLEAALGVTPVAPVPSDSANVAAPMSPASVSGVAALVSGPATTDQTSQTQTPQDLSDRIGNIEERLKNFGPFTFSGDFRLRDEPFFGGPSNQSLDQNRERFRLRFNVTAKLNDDFGGGFSLASGDINDPTSTNQTVTGFYTRKAIAIDKAYVDYTPHQFHYLTLIGGKFGYPWYNTELTWDKDLNPEGVAETLVFNTSTPVLKKIAFVGFELPFSQVAGVSTTNQSSVASVVYGGQVQTTWQLARWLKFGAYTGFYNYHNADPIALALAKASAKNPQTPLTGLLPLGTGNTMQNSIVTTTATDEVTIGGTSYPTGVTTVTNAQFASKFGLFDSLARFDIATRSGKWPIAFIGDYVQNTEACANVDNILGAPANTASVHYAQSANFACDPRQRRGYWGEVQVGRGQKRGDWQFDYTHMFIEREAVLSNFDYSDIRQGSNVTEHRAMVIYQVHRNVQTSFTALIGRPLNFGSTAPAQDWLQRLQFDVIYSF
jgi:Putative porin